MIHDWRPAASRQAMEARADVQADIRAFFRARSVLEVETPVLAQAGVTDVHLVNATTALQGQGLPVPTQYYFQTSPEYAMKRLLAAGIGDCFQLCKVVRDEELSARHNFEFTMLEWYRLGFNDQQLMDEVELLLRSLLPAPAAQRLSYQQAFLQTIAVDPLSATTAELATAITREGIDCHVVQEDRDGLLNLAMSLLVEPRLNPEQPTFVYHFPASQAVLARQHHTDARVAHRFELFYKGLELANGFLELTNPVEQRERFERDNAARLRLGLPSIPLDERLLSALEHGLPDCAGVALGVDRLLMIKLNAQHIDQVLTFPSLRA